MSGWEMIGWAFGITAIISTVLIALLCIVAKACGILPAAEEDDA